MERTHQIHVDIAVVLIARLQTPRDAARTHLAFLSVSPPPPHRAPRGREREEFTFFSRFGSTASWKDVEPSKDRGTKGGEDHVGFVRDELVLDRKRDFLGCVERLRGRNGGQSIKS